VPDGSGWLMPHPGRFSKAVCSQMKAMTILHLDIHICSETSG